MRPLFTFYQFIGKYKARMAVYLTVVVLSMTLEAVRPYWLKMILDSVESTRTEKAFVYLGLFGLSTFGASWVSALSYFLRDRVMIPLGREVRETVFQKVMELDFAYHINKNTGSLISAFRRGDSAVYNIFESIHSELVRVLVSLVVTLIFLERLSPILAIIMSLMFTVNLGIIVWLVKNNLKARVEFNNSEDKISGIIADSMINYETVKFFAAEVKERGRLNREFDDWFKKFWRFSNSFRLMDIIIGTTSGVGMLYILWLVIGKVGHGFSSGDLVMVAGLVTNFYYQFFNMFFRIREIAKNMTDMEKYLGILDCEVTVKDPIESTCLTKPRGGIEFKNVGFVYPKTKEKILDGINLKIKAGERVAFVGRSGTGKTTLTKLLMRFYDPSIGVIKIDGVDIKNMKKADLRKVIGMVPQEPIMFNNTIKFNLAYGNENANDEDIKETAKKANILEFIERLPDKWETQVGERGIKLSGGQKQRLAIARAMLTDPKILVFDEATSNLDSESEKMIQVALGEAAKTRTVLIIAHRFSTIRDADKIVVLSNGNIVETGKHEDLIKLNGIYNRLWTLQTKGKLPMLEN